MKYIYTSLTRIVLYLYFFIHILYMYNIVCARRDLNAVTISGVPYPHFILSEGYRDYSEMFMIHIYTKVKCL